MPDESTFFIYAMPLGRMTIGARGPLLAKVAFGPKRFEGEEHASAVSNEASTQLMQYFSGKRTVFDVPLEPAPTAFQQAVREQVMSIPYGQTRTYSEIAASIGEPGAARAVGRAVNANPLLVVVPCHRVIGADGGLTGYAAGLKLKRYLLDLERATA